MIGQLERLVAEVGKLAEWDVGGVVEPEGPADFSQRADSAAGIEIRKGSVPDRGTRVQRNDVIGDQDRLVAVQGSVQVQM